MCFRETWLRGLVVSGVLCALCNAELWWTGDWSGDFYDTRNWAPEGFSIGPSSKLIVRFDSYDPCGILPEPYMPLASGLGFSHDGYLVMEGSYAAIYVDSGSVSLSDAARISVLNGAQLLSGPAGTFLDDSGSIDVAGSGSSWLSTGGMLLEGGRVDITNGGLMRIHSSVQIAPAPYSSSSAAVAVDGAGSQLGIGSTLAVDAVSHNGTLSVSNGGLVTVGSEMSVGSFGTGTVNVLSGASLTSGATYIGQYGGSSGTIALSGAGTVWTCDGAAFVGLGGTGEVSVVDGATVANTGSLTLGSLEDTSGRLVVSGAGSRWTSSGTLRAGKDGTGQAEIASGGVMSVADAYVGDQTGSSGSLLVGGVGSSLSMGATLHIAHEGDGTMQALDGGTVRNGIGYIAYESGTSGAVTVSGGGTLWDNAEKLVVGRKGTGTLAVTQGGEVRNTDGYVGSQPNSQGGVTVSGAGSTWQNTGTLFLGDQGAGSLAIEQGGRVTSDTGRIGSKSTGQGAVTLTGAGSCWKNALDLYVGEQGIGSLEIDNGGAVTARGGSIGDQADSSGRVTVEGAGSRLDLSSMLSIGAEGSGTLEVLSGGQVTSGETAIAFGPSSQGVATLSGADSRWTISGNLSIGRAGGGSGDFTLRNGATADVLGNLWLSRGTALLEGAATCADVAGEMKVGTGGAGTLTIRDGARLSVGELAYLGGATELPTQATVDGRGSALSLGGELRVGNSGGAGLTISGGASVSNDLAFLGYAPGVSGIVTVDGPGSKWSSTGDVIVGREGIGTLTIRNGASVTSGWVGMCDQIGSEATVTVTGTGSSWTNDTLHVAAYGLGTMNIVDGGRVNSTRASVAFGDPSSIGNVTIADGGNWRLTERLDVGNQGTGTINVRTGGTLAMDMELLLGAGGGSGTVNIDGGTVSAMKITASAGTGHVNLRGGSLTLEQFPSAGPSGLINWTGGAIDVTGALGVTLGPTGPLGPSVTVGSSKSFSDTGRIYVSPGTTLTVSGGTFSTQELQVEGSVRLWGGDIDLGAGFAVWNGATLELAAGKTWAPASTLYLGDLSLLKVRGDRLIAPWNEQNIHGNVELTHGGEMDLPGDAFIGRYFGSDSSVTVSGADSLLDVGWNLIVGDQGTGRLTVRDGGAVNVSGPLYLGFQSTGVGTLELRGGSVAAESISVLGGTGHLDWTSGQLALTTGFMVGGGAPVGNALSMTPGMELRASNLYVAQDGTLSLLGGSIFTDALSVSGRARLLRGSCSFGSWLTVYDGGLLEIAAGQSITATSGATLNTNAKLILGGSLSVPDLDVPSGASLQLAGGHLALGTSQSVTNEGELYGSGTLGTSLANLGEMRVGLNERLTVEGYANNISTVTLSGGTLWVQGSLTNSGGGIIMGTGSLRSSNTININGTLAFSGATTVEGDVNNQAGVGPIAPGLIIVSGAGPTTFLDDVTNDGEIRVSAGSMAVYFGAVTGSGAFTGGGTNSFEGDLRPGSSPGELTFAGNVSFGHFASLIMELGGLAQGTEYDHISVAGNLELNGILNVHLWDSFNPAFGDSFDLLDWSFRTGTFDMVNLPTLAGGLMWDTSNLYSSGSISVVPEPATLALMILGGLAMLRRKS